MAEGRRLRTLLAALFLTVALAFVVVLLLRQWTSLDEILAATRDFPWSVRPVWLVAAWLVAVGDLMLMGSVWAGLFRRTGGSARRWECVRIWVITNFGRYIPGKIWQLGGLTVYMKGRGESGAAALVSAVAFQIISLVTGAAVAAATVGVHWVAAGGSWLPAAVTLAVTLIVGLHPAVIRWMARRLGGLMGEDAVVVDLRTKDVVLAAGGMLIAWVVYGVGLLLLLRGVGVAWEVKQLHVLTGVFAASYVVGYMALIAPGGLVVREGAMTGLLTELSEMPVGVAAAVAILARLWLVGAELGALALVLAWPAKTAIQERDA